MVNSHQGAPSSAWGAGSPYSPVMAAQPQALVAHGSKKAALFHLYSLFPRCHLLGSGSVA